MRNFLKMVDYKANSHIYYNKTKLVMISLIITEINI